MSMMSKKILVSVLLVTALLLVMQSLMFAQAAAAPASGATVSDQDVALLRQDIRSKKKQLIAANMNLTDAQAEKFWPVYDQYTLATTKIGDQKYALIKEYAQTYDTMTDAQADSLLKQLEAVDEQVVKTRVEWMPNFHKVLTGKQTALFYQLDRRFALLVDLQLASMIPVVDTTK